MTGKIDISNLKTPPEKLEFEAAKYFANLGKDIQFICPSAIPNQHRPDIIMDGIEWEIKSPLGSSKRTIENNMRKAIKQSCNIIFDLRRIKLSEAQAINQLKKEFNHLSKLRKLYIITKSGELITLVKKG